MGMVFRRLATGAIFAGLSLAATFPVDAASKSAKAAPASSKIDFNRDIRSLLSDNCFACHGPDDKERKAKLRFDDKVAALKPAKSGDYAIVPGDPAKSKLIERITSKDPDDLMPPPKTGKKLNAQQIELLRRWIQEGAKFEGHWAFTAPERPALPTVKDTKWSRNEIDRFILARLEKEKLKPSPGADKVTLIRRVTLDLTGLPPTLAEVDAFVADTTPTAYERVVHRLLNSPRYGEHMARYWLDAARYADSHGYHIDSERSMWKWRDWVVDAFNQNKPYDQFTIEQLAGDLLPEPTSDQKVASGYVRANMSTGEGGAIVEEYQTKYTFDRTETTSTIWLGLTMTCCRCHTHKYDPITHREYYGLYSFFNNLNESVMDGNKPNPEPFMKLPSPEQSKRQAQLKTLIAEGQKKVDAPVPELDTAQTAWESKWHGKLSAGWTTLVPAKISSTASNGPAFTVLEDQSILAEGTNPESDVHEVIVKVGSEASIAALRLEALPHDALPKKSSSRADDGVFRLSEFEAEVVAPTKAPIDWKEGEKPVDEKAAKQAEAPKPKKLKFTQAVASSAASAREIDKAIDGKADTGWGVEPAAATEAQTALFVLAEPVKVTKDSELRLRLRYEASKSKRAIGHFRLAAAQNDELVQLLNPPKAEPWQVIGPFKTEGLHQGFTNVFEPEREIDLKKKFAGVRDEIKWNAKPDFEDGKNNLLVQDLHGIHGAYYLYRTLKVPAARKLDLSLRADDALKLWVNGKQVIERAEEKPGDGLLRATVDLKQGENKLLFKIVTVQGAAYFTFNKDLGDTDAVPADVAAVLATTKKLVGAQLTKVRNFYRREHSPDFKQLFESMDKWREEDTAVDKAIPVTMVAKEMDKPRDTFILVRGEYDKKGDKVEPGLPAILPPLPKGAPTNRLGLAKWLVDPSHPLTARVTINRFWQQYFGTGFVKTAEDFGVQGENPSHPELLDWLATEFIRTGWDVKEIQRLIVTSATYRQSSRTSPELYGRDPENRLLARGPRFRADGEVVRDSALFISGLLSQTRGGRAVKPYEPPGLWEAVSFNNSQKYVPDKGESLYRRSLYTYWKRQSPPPNMLLFDAPTREYCVVRRPRTNTPLQALALMNDLQFVEASRAFAQRIMMEGGTSAGDRINHAFRLATSRLPVAAEVKVLQEIFNQQLAEFRRDRGAAEKLLGAGNFKANGDLDQSELAAWTTIASMILNLDETVTKS
jgi:mono/diheme cytochrome c family protein